jgi:rhomboid-like protein
VSHVVNAKFRFPRILARLSRVPAATAPPRRFFPFRAAPAAEDAAATVERSSRILPSLGASGAIYASVTLTALAFPDAVVSLIFPPTHPIPIEWGVGGLVLLDVIGALRGWRCADSGSPNARCGPDVFCSLFDHWAHLGGAAFGAFYYAYGPRIWDFLRSLDAEMIEEEAEVEGHGPENASDR